MPIAVDVEDNKMKPLSADALTDLVIAAANAIESWGMYAMVYTYTYYSNTELNMDRLSAYDLWIADGPASAPPGSTACGSTPTSTRCPAFLSRAVW